MRRCLIAHRTEWIQLDRRPRLVRLLDDAGVASDPGDLPAVCMRPVLMPSENVAINHDRDGTPIRQRDLMSALSKLLGVLVE